ncbi:OmpA family protein [Allomuricauda taeanensis]|uniref:OmpA family protein n=1 Tax=Flagellimonas taeanensis TaxID=1005926 RepID=UPI002E7B1BAF|nr:OmpA family protein [Allomuricauda taeanensis]MEE1963318.1 OmpA family protein [Allomuricauda taeanensis]
MKTGNLRHITLIVLLSIGVLSAQEAKVKKADEQFDSYAYIDARKIYLNVVEDGYESAQVFKKLGDTYYFNSEYSEAAKWYKKLFQSYPNDVEPEYYYRTAQTLKSMGEYSESEKMMDKYMALSGNSKVATNLQNSAVSLQDLTDDQTARYRAINITEGLSSSDFGPTFNGNKIVFASSSKNTEGGKTHDWNGLPYLDLYEAEIGENGALENPIALEGDINTPYHESSAVFTKDGKTMYFTRNNYINGKKKRDKKRLVSLKIYKASKKDNGSWGDVEELPFNSNSYSVAHPALNRTENRLYFSSDMEGSLGRSDLWYVDILGNGQYGQPVNLGPKINTEERESFPFVSESGNLYFSSDGHMGLGGLDVFVVSLNGNGQFKTVTNLKAPINSSQDDFGFIIDESQKTGYFSSNREGNEGSVSDDIYAFNENCNAIIKGIITDEKTGKPLEGSLVTLLDENNKVVSQKTVQSNGDYSFEGIADCGTQYAVRASNNEMDYEPKEKTLITPVGVMTTQVDLALAPPDCPINDLGCRLDLQPIYFDFDKHTIRPDAEVELAKILQAMKEYPQLVIHIESHTDSRGDDNYNRQLSDRRAKSTMEWLVKKGVDRNRLSAKGYGESQLVNKCSNGTNCSEQDHQFNRRSMFLIKN